MQNSAKHCSLQPPRRNKSNCAASVGGAAVPFFSTFPPFPPFPPRFSGGFALPDSAEYERKSQCRSAYGNGCGRKSGEKIGAEHIKALLKNGDVSAADKLLCGGFILTGEVKKDRGIGATIGFPTANIFYPEGKTELKKGVYETRAEVGGVTYKGITNFGSRPTFGNDTVVTETHLIGFRGNLYGKTLTVRFVRYLRDVAAFKNAEELTARLHADVKRVEEGK